MISAPHAFFGLWQRKVGLSFGWGGGQRLLKRMSPSALNQKFIEAQTMSSYEALKLGLIDQITSSDHLLDQAKTWIINSQNLPTKPLATIKNWGRKNEADVFKSLWMKDDHQKFLNRHFKN